MDAYKNKKKLLLLGFVLLLYTLVLLPLLIINLQKRQELRGKAAGPTPTPPVCGNAPVDVMLILDKSGSMNSQVGSSGTKLSNAKAAAKSFIDILSQNTNNHVGLVSFAGTATLNSSLTNNYSSVKNQIDAITTANNTCTQCGVTKANQEIAANGRTGIKKVAVLLTDGIANFIEGGSGTTSSTSAQQATLTAVNSGNAASGTVFFTIGLGTDVNGPFLSTLATTTGGTYNPSPTSDQLNTIYTQISNILGKGSLTGTAFSDTNGNGVFDTAEQTLPGWTIQLYTGTNPTPQTFMTDTSGNFAITGLCDGNYTVKQIPQTGWQQTTPTNSQGYSVTVTNGSSFSDKNFGNTQAITPTKTPTPTPLPTSVQATSLGLTILLDGLGNRGDNANPTESSLSNKNPLHSTKATDVQVFNASNQLVASGNGTITYNTSTGNFTGTIAVGTAITSGNYTVKIRTQQYLRKLVAGIQVLTSGQVNPLPVTALVAGDINFDNQLSILDYSLLLDCYSDIAAAPNCTDPNKKNASDINDDGNVNQFDYNLLLRELSTQPGE